MGWNDLIGASFGDDQQHYIIEEEIARGGMSRVFRAHEVPDGRVVALKVMALGSEGGGDTRTFTRRFEHEARAVERLDHPNIVKVYTTGRNDEFVYIAMQLVLGGTFRQRLGRPMPIADACFQMIQMARALHHAHMHHVIHRDVKPANMLIDDQDPSHLLLADFGIAKIIGQKGVTKTGTAVGTPEYMAPEQAKGEEIDQRADIYGLACVLYEALAGRPPFVGPTALSICYQHVHTRPAYIRGFNPEVPRALALVIEQALAKNPRDRFATAEDFANALYPFTESVGRGTRPSVPLVDLNVRGDEDEDLDLIDHSSERTNDAEAFAMPMASLDGSNITSPMPEASAMLDLSTLATRHAPIPDLAEEDATMRQTQEMTPVSEPLRPRHTRPVQPGLRLKSRPITRPREAGDNSTYPPFDPDDATRLPTIQTPATPPMLPASRGYSPSSSFSERFTQPSRSRTFILIVAALFATLLTLLVISHVHSGKGTALVTAPTATLTLAPTFTPLASPTQAATQQPTMQPTATPPAVNAATILYAANVTSEQDLSCTVASQTTFPTNARLYVNACVRSGYGQAKIWAYLTRNGQFNATRTLYGNGGGFPLPFGPLPSGSYVAQVYWNNSVAQTVSFTVQ
jgi:serine/threonine protein kinase